MSSTANGMWQKALDALCTAQLPETWVTAAWTNSLCDFDNDYPIEEGGAPTAEKPLAMLHAAIAGWPKNASDDESLWLALADKGVSLKALLAQLAFFVDKGAMAVEPTAALYAGAAYVELLALPGASAHQAFAAMLLRATLKQLLRVAPELVTSRTKAPKKQAPRPNTSDIGLSADLDEQADDDEPSLEMTAAATKATKALLVALVKLLEAYSLRPTPELLDLAMQAASILATVETNVGSVTAEVLLAAPTTSASFAVLAMKAMAAAASAAQQQENSGHVRTVAKHLLAHLNLTFGGATSVSASAVAMQRRCLDFLEAISTMGIVDQESFAHALKLLAQHLCTSVPDRNEFRQCAGSGVSRLLSIMSAEGQETFLPWLLKFARNAKAGFRTFALDAAGAILADVTVLVSSDAAVECRKRLFQLIVMRCSDKAPAVRAKALSQLATLLSVQQQSEETKNILGRATASLWETCHASSPSAGQATARMAADFKDVLRRRLVDSKGAVRKAAVVCLESFLLNRTGVTTAGEVEMLGARCCDAGLSVRKQALISLHNVATQCSDDSAIISVFVRLAMPLVMDREDGVRNKCMDILHDLIFGAMEMGESPEKALAWRMLQTINDEPEALRFLRRACAEFARSKRITENAVFELQKGSRDGREAAWMLLGEVSAHSPALVDTDFVLKAWYERDLDNAALATAILNVLGCASQRLEPLERKKLTENLRRLLLSFSVEPPLIASSLLALARLAGAAPDSGTGSVEKIAQEMLIASETKLRAVGQDFANLGRIDELTVARLIFSLGECAVFAPRAVSTAMVQAIEAIVAHEAGVEMDMTAESAVTLSGKGYSGSLRAHAYLALGKLCLQREGLAKKWLAAMARELETCQSPAVRNNIIVVMSDLCVRYPSTANRYLPTLALGLRDSSSLVRRQTLALLTRLLTEDYVKLREGIFFRLLVTMVDPDPAVRQLGTYCIVSIIHKKDPTVLRVHFVESLFHLNDVVTHAKYNRFPQSEAERAKFSLAGDDNRNKRAYIYRMLLEPMTDLDKLQITQLIIQEVLAGVVDGVLKLSDETDPVIRDALRILVSKELKLNAASRDDTDEEVSAISKAKANLVSKISKKNLVENIVPVVISFKNILEKQRSPLLRPLLTYLREIMAEHKQEVQDIMAADRQLAQELTFDLKKFENDSRRASIASLAATPSQLSPQLAQTEQSTSGIPSPMTPGFAAPRVRRTAASTQPAIMRQSSLRRVAAVPATSVAATPKQAAQTPSSSLAHAAAFVTPRIAPSSAPQSAAKGARTPMTPHAQPLGWVRASSSAKSTSKPDASPKVDGADILLESPANARREAPKQWKLATPTFSKPRAEKRMTEETDMEENDPLLSDLVAVLASKRAK